MKLLSIILLIIGIVCIESFCLSLRVSANSQQHSKDAPIELSRASAWDRFRATLQDSYSKFEGELVKRKALVGEVLSKLNIPEMFNWSRYKAAYLKVYNNVREDLARQKIFFANALKIVAHNIGFRIGDFTHFLSVNQFADYTPEESTRVYMREDELKSENPNNSDDNCQKQDSENEETMNSRVGRIRGGQAGLGKLNEADSKGPLVVNSRELVEESTIVDPVDSKDDSSQKQKSNTKIDDAPTYTEYEVDSSVAVLEDENNQVYRDLRDSGCFFKPRNQGKCASCYAFAAVALMEWWHCKRTGQLIPFSEQYMVDCGKYERLDGCQGGNAPRTGKFLMNWGVQLRDQYPYIASQSSCPYDQDEWEHASYKRPILSKYAPADYSLMWPQMLEQSGPILVLIRIPTPGDFLFYGGKVHKGDNCESSDRFVHGMLIVGHGKEDGQEYWLFRNSFGRNWGEGGYFKLSKNFDPICFYWANELQVQDFVNGSPQPSGSPDRSGSKKLKPSEAYLMGYDSDKDLSMIVDSV